MRNYVEADDIRLVYSGKNYFDELAGIINNSREILHLQTYIFETDETGFKVMDWLKQAAARGVKVYLMVDAYASFPFPSAVAADLRAAGVYFRLYSPLLSSESIFIGRRLHHKIVVADRKTGMIGGINIADKYNINVVENAWLDYAVKIEGDVCQYLHLLCEQFYKRSPRSVLKLWEKNLHALNTPDTGKYVRFRRNDWIRGRNEIHKSYLEAIVKAESSITMVASYFLPGNRMRRLMRMAAARGVKVKVLMAGRSDISSLRLAEQFLYDYYLRNGIEVYEWTDSVLHGKAMIVDGTWVTIGSYNLNFLSHYVSIELNADIIDPSFSSVFTAHLDEILDNNCKRAILNTSWKWNNQVARLLRWLAYNFYRLLMAMAMQGKKYRRKNE